MHNKRIFITLGIMLLLFIYMQPFIQATAHTEDGHFFVDKSRSTLFLGRGIKTF